MRKGSGRTDKVSADNPANGSAPSEAIAVDANELKTTVMNEMGDFIAFSSAQTLPVPSQKRPAQGPVAFSRKCYRPVSTAQSQESCGGISPVSFCYTPECCVSVAMQSSKGNELEIPVAQRETKGMMQ
jgi:hypothetical protein